MMPFIGQIVLYQLTEQDVNQINRRRTTGKSIAERIALQLWPIGAQAHIGDEVEPGQTFPMVIVRIHYMGLSELSVNGQVLLDGNDVLWVQDKREIIDWRMITQ